MDRLESMFNDTFLWSSGYLWYILIKIDLNSWFIEKKYFYNDEIGLQAQ